METDVALWRGLPVPIVKEALEGGEEMHKTFFSLQVCTDAIILPQRTISFPPFLLFLHYNLLHSNLT
jgi:hypothetical protein